MCYADSLSARLGGFFYRAELVLLLTEIALAPPLWVHALLWTPLIVALSLAGLRPLKGVTVALQYKFRSVEEPAEPGGQ